MKIWPVIERALETHGTCAMVSVVRTDGSAPREAGARMIVTPAGFHGTIGGGTLEWKALAQAQVLLGKPRAVKHLTQSLGPDLGQCCGGRVVLAIESFSTDEMPDVRRWSARELQGPFALRGRLQASEAVETFGEARRSVLVFGAGHVGRALVLALAALPYDVVWSDPRPEAFPGAAPGNARVSAGDPMLEIARAPEGSLCFVMSHSHALDLAIIDAALRNTAIAEVGVIGSSTKRARFEKRLREAGVPHERVARLICPIGVSGIRSKLPAAIAAATAAQIVMLDEAHTAAVQDETGHQRAAAG